MTDGSSLDFLDISLLLVFWWISGKKGRPKGRSLLGPPLVITKVDTLSESAQ